MGNPFIITLTTDFGSKDPFVGVMKGVMLNINPLITIIDITHNISPQNISEAAIAVEASFSYFPHNTIHVVVVDPGVGSDRRPLIVSADYHYFIGPDNGIFSRIYKKSESLDVFHVTAEHYFLPRRSATFHGRDIFAPVAAWLAKGIHLERFGDPITDYVTLPLPAPVFLQENTIEGEVVYIDSFGNLITNIRDTMLNDLLSKKPAGNVTVTVSDREAPVKACYAASADKKLCSIIDSFNYLELFVNGGNAATEFGISVGEKVRVSLL
jgi:S-adenosyl-L-methionine hydrolase (adenosine-forming)